MGYIGAIIAAAGAIAGGIIKNQANKRAATRQYNRNQQDRSFQVVYDQALWQQQNKKNQELWNQQNRYNENRIDTENQYSRDTWDLENKYNSPQSQMARYSKAGLNPHLIYGQGTPGNAGDLASGSMRAEQAESNGMSSPDAKGYTREQAETIALGQKVFNDQLQDKNLQAQTDNVEAQTDIARQEAINKATDGLQKTQELSKTSRLEDHQVDAARINVDQQREIQKQHQAKTHIADSTKEDKIKIIAKEAKIAGQKLKGIKLDNAMKRYLDMLKEVGLDSAHPLYKSIYLYLKRNGSPVKKMDGSKYTY